MNYSPDYDIKKPKPTPTVPNPLPDPNEPPKVEED